MSLVDKRSLPRESPGRAVFHVKVLIPMFYGNQAANPITFDPVCQDRTKHIKANCHLIQKKEKKKGTHKGSHWYCFCEV